jgi:putative ABC transport system permease protein
MLGELRYAVRSLSGSPGFTLVAVLALALGIGASTSIFSVVNAVLLEPLPYPDPDRLVLVWERSSRMNVANNRAPGSTVNPINFLEWRSRNQSFERMAAFIQYAMNLTGEAEPEQVLGLAVTDGFFEILGARAALGRTFRPEEDAPENNNVVVLSHELWQRRWGGDPAVVGRKITVNNRLLEVVGVMAPAFRFPGTRAELWMPFGIDRARLARAGRFFSAVARLRPGVSLERAQADMSVVAAQLRDERPDVNAKWSVGTIELREQAVGETRTALLVLFAAVGFVLMIACANVASLMLIRATRRERELAVRTALGASRARLVRQLLVESVTLALAGGALGAVAAVGATRLLVAMIPDSMSVYNVTAVGVNRTVLLFTLVITFATGVLFGVAPALKAGRIDPHDALKEGARGTSGAGSRARAALVVAEVALSMVLLVAAGLLLRSFERLLAVEPGFHADKVLTMRLAPGARFQNDQQSAAFLEQVLERVRTLPEVKAAGSISFLPLSGLLSATSFWRGDRPQPPPGEQSAAQTFVIAQGYFAAMGIPLLDGRTFDARDRDGAPFVAIVNRELANRFFAGENPVGKRLHVQWGHPQATYEIVGVVGSVRHLGLDKSSEPALFLANRQEPGAFFHLVIRTSGDPMWLAPAVRSEIRAIERDIPVSEVRTMEQYVERSVARPRFNMLLITTFAGLALALAALGLFGVISYSVAQRTHEIGIRRALGAADGRVVAMVLKQGMTLAVAGVVLGLAGAFALTRFLETLLFGVTPTDSVTFASVAAVLVAVTLGACYVPARRAAQVDPMVALRCE